jgi:flavin-binding protein dodecin
MAPYVAMLWEEDAMTERVFKKVELVGGSSASIEKAIEAAISKASATLHNLSWFEVAEIRGAIKDGKPIEWQVTVRVGFKLD